MPLQQQQNQARSGLGPPVCCHQQTLNRIYFGFFFFWLLIVIIIDALLRDLPSRTQLLLPVCAERIHDQNHQKVLIVTKALNNSTTCMKSTNML